MKRWARTISIIIHTFALLAFSIAFTLFAFLIAFINVIYSPSIYNLQQLAVLFIVITGIIFLGLIYELFILWYFSREKVYHAFGLEKPDKSSGWIKRIGSYLDLGSLIPVHTLHGKNRLPKLTKRIEKAESLFNEHKVEKARKLYENVIKAISTSEEISKEERPILGKAYLGLGLIQIAGEDKPAAFVSFQNAWKEGASLPNEAIILLGECYAKQNTGETAVDIYLRYIGLKPESDPAARGVYSVLENICKVDEDTPSHLTEKLKTLNVDVFNANNSFEWNNYNLGLVNFLQGDKRSANNYFRHAQELNPNRARTRFFLGQLELMNNHHEDALAHLRKSITLDPSQADASFLIGKILVDQLEGMS